MNNKPVIDKSYIEREREYWDAIVCDIVPATSLYDGWLDKYQLDAYDKTKLIIELGCGWGSTTEHLQALESQLICCDLSPKATELIGELYPHVATHCFSMTDAFIFASNSCDCIVADLCLHYFDDATLGRILSEICRVLKPSGQLLCRVNSINDINYGAGRGIEIAKGLFLYNDRYKRFFDRDSVISIFGRLDIAHLAQTTIHKYDKEKKVYEIMAYNK